MAGGRPSKYSSDYCDKVIATMAEGHSVTAFAGEIGVSRSTVFNWANEYPEFMDALKAGQAAATRFWESILVKVARDGGGNATAAIFGLKNRAAEDWADKIVNEHTGRDGGPIETVDLTEQEAARRIAFTLAKATQVPTQH